MGLVVTLIVFYAARWLQSVLKAALLNPVLISMLVLIAGLVTLEIPYVRYAASADWLTRLLEPSVVALAVPLYRNLPALRRGARRILRSSVVGSLGAMGLTVAANLLLGASREVALSTLPKSVTTPIALAIGAETGGTAGLTVVSVVVAGIVGAAFGPSLLNRARVRDPGARGLAMGAASHALGTARIGEESDAARAHASVAIVTCGVITALLAPLVARAIVAWWP